MTLRKMGLKKSCIGRKEGERRREKLEQLFLRWIIMMTQQRFLALTWLGVLVLKN
jgi:hypothetical protein